MKATPKRAPPSSWPSAARWRSAAARLGATFPPSRLHRAVREWAGGQRDGRRWAIGFSGGADSLALLLLLWAHWPGRRDRLVALHFNHRLRGRAAQADERFCRRVCAALGVAYRSGTWADAPAAASEAEARNARQAFFIATLRRLRTPVLWLGHQQDDVVESMLMRLARGSGVGGLAAPRPVQRMADGRVHLRPLLTLRKAGIVAALRELRLPWREDATNRSPAYLRNRMRARVVQAWVRAAAGRDAVAGAALSRDLLEEDEAALDIWAARYAVCAARTTMPLLRLKREPRAVVRRVLHRWLAARGCGETLSRQAFETLLDDIIAGRTVRRSVGTARCAAVSPRRLAVEPAPAKKSRSFHRAVN